LRSSISPAVAARRGRVTLVGVDHGLVLIRLEGGCHRFGLAKVSVRQGIEPLLWAHLPGIAGVVDVTDHEAGTAVLLGREAVTAVDLMGEADVNPAAEPPRVLLLVPARIYRASDV
jgi:Fe-S cluster biogenesis protein NfuA